MEKRASKITHPNKILYPEDKINKMDLFNYYDQVSSEILPFIVDRPLTLVRCPDNYQSCFYQKKLKSSKKSPLKTIKIKDETNNDNYIYLKDDKGLFELAQLSTLEIHPWGSRIDDYEKPDILIIDLDPSPELAWIEVVHAAFEVKNYLDKYQLKSYVKTTGGKGLHVVIPILPEYAWDEVKEFSYIFVKFLEKINPHKYVSNMSKIKRTGKIFIDYLRNQRGATSIAPYSPRARIHAPVSVPLAWDELTHNKKDTEFTLTTLPYRLKHMKTKPWHDFWIIQQSLDLEKLK